jgi:hypothetical protein
MHDACDDALTVRSAVHTNHRKDLSSGEACYRKAISLAPSRAGCHVNLAVLLAFNKDPPDFDQYDAPTPPHPSRLHAMPTPLAFHVPLSVTQPLLLFRHDSCINSVM